MKLHSLKQTKDLLVELIQAKRKYDEQCLTNRQPRETLEQFMFTFLNQRYGLKQLIVEWASSIVYAVKIYSPEDAQVHLFGKILKNSVEEDFWQSQETMRLQLASILKVCYKERLQNKLLQEVHKHVEDVISDRFGLDTWVQNRIIERIFAGKEDQNEVTQKLVEKLKQKRNDLGNLLQKENVSATRHNRSARADFLKSTETVRLAYSEFQLIVLEFQLKKHEEFLSGFLQLFKNVDSDADGVLNEDQFMELICKMKIGLTEEQTLAFLEHLDPFNQQRITFSDIIRLLSTQKTVTDIAEPQKKVKKHDLLQTQTFDEHRSIKSQNEIPKHHQESYNLRDSMQMSDTNPHIMPLSEQILNFDKIASGQEKSFLSQQPTMFGDSQRLPHFEIEKGANNRTNSFH